MRQGEQFRANSELREMPECSEFCDLMIDQKARAINVITLCTIALALVGLWTVGIWMVDIAQIVFRILWPT
jgi:hypothetical protein